ncbi:ribbon-helix-helix domain-containing protein [Pseudomonas sp. ABC1]|uniref:ribbon-helix-helix domain-containing protein n=1 Tax=Pseudomonas sp. ABC1 TaxID=2748080 RepID=UPI0015C36A14|nr:ribbon-helix-helix domain-containing protein [Pseudomonas sp. ABC1]QLF92674.1 ribbon-helix-helix domain-containing protein [Pseudomonas sp. ABC1]
MCHIYVSTDPRLYECQTRSVRIQGVVTSVRLENEFWSILEEIAAGEGYGVPQFINQVYDEVILRNGEVSNLASLLRVICTVYLSNNRESAAPAQLLALAPVRRAAASARRSG